MGKHEIRMRRQRLTARGTDRFKNYGAVLKQHEDEKRMKKIVRVFTFFLLIVLAVVLIVMVNRWEKKVGSRGSEVRSWNYEVRSKNIDFKSHKISETLLFSKYHILCLKSHG